jgi:SagB-type dehydrogenase family enzyme
VEEKMAEEDKESENKARSRALAYEAIYDNHCQMLSAWPDALGFRTQLLRSRTLGQSSDFRLAESFLINTRFVRNDYEYKESVEWYFTDEMTMTLSLIGQTSNAGLPEIALPEGTPMPMEVDEAFRQRRSRRSYRSTTLPLDTLAALLRSAAGVTAIAEVASSQKDQTYTYRFRTSPSAGGLYPLDLYVAALNVEGLERGCYCYNPVPDRLTCVGDAADLKALLSCFAFTEDLISLSSASLIFLMVGYPWRAMRKYGPRGMRFLFHDAGAMSENIHLASVALGLGSTDFAGVYEDEVHRVMGWDGLYQALIHCIVVGRMD